MRVFRTTIGTEYERTNTEKYKYEKGMQEKIETNLDTFFPHLDFVDSEFSIGGDRVDTVAYDTERDCFVIIEYKNIKSESVLNQCIAYQQKMKIHKTDLVLSFNKKWEKQYDTRDFDWNAAYVMIVAPEFTKHQLQGKDSLHNIELHQIHTYKRGIIILDQLNGEPHKDIEEEETTKEETQLPVDGNVKQLQQQGITISDFKAGKNLPVYLTCKDDRPVMCKRWIHILEGVANYLIEHNYINKSDCPITSGPKIAILNTSKKNQTGTIMRNHKQIKQGFYLNANLNAQGIINNAKKLVEYSSLPLEDFRISMQTSIVATQPVLIEKTNQDYTLLKFQTNVQLPIEILYPDQTSKICKTWRHILLHTVSYLVGKNYITKDNCPILGRTNPIVTKDKPRFNLEFYAQLQDGFYVYQQLNKKCIVQTTIRLLKHVNLNPEDFIIRVIKI